MRDRKEEKRKNNDTLFATEEEARLFRDAFARNYPSACNHQSVMPHILGECPRHDLEADERSETDSPLSECDEECDFFFSNNPCLSWQKEAEMRSCGQDFFEYFVDDSNTDRPSRGVYLVSCAGTPVFLETLSRAFFCRIVATGFDTSKDDMILEEWKEHYNLILPALCRLEEMCLERVLLNVSGFV